MLNPLRCKALQPFTQKLNLLGSSQGTVQPKIVAIVVPVEKKTEYVPNPWHALLILALLMIAFIAIFRSLAMRY